jgi:MFS family permease
MLGLLTGYGSLSVAMAAESAPRDRMPSAIGLVQTAQRIGPGVGPVLGGALAGLVGLRRAFIATALFYAVALVVVHVMYDDRATHASRPVSSETGRVTFRNVLAFQNFILMMSVIFALQFVDRSFGPVLPLYVEQVGVTHERVAIVAGVLFSIMAGAGALGHHFCGRLLRRFTSRAVISGAAAVAALGCGLFGLSGQVWVMSAASVLLGVGIGARRRPPSAAGAVIPPGAPGSGWRADGASPRKASSPLIADSRRRVDSRRVFVDLAMMALLAGVILKSAPTTNVTRPMRNGLDEKRPGVRCSSDPDLSPCVTFRKLPNRFSRRRRSHRPQLCGRHYDPFSTLHAWPARVRGAREGTDAAQGLPLIAADVTQIAAHLGPPERPSTSRNTSGRATHARRRAAGHSGRHAGDGEVGVRVPADAWRADQRGARGL